MPVPSPPRRNTNFPRPATQAESAGTWNQCPSSGDVGRIFPEAGSCVSVMISVKV